MLCKEVMRRDVFTIGSGDTLVQAARLMREEKVGFLPVLASDRSVIGVVTDRDIVVRAIADNRPLSAQVREVMSRDVVACKPTDDLREAERLMAMHKRTRIVIIDQGRLVGVVSRADLPVEEAVHRRAAPLESRQD
jgi:CBS domain-containing protein